MPTSHGHETPTGAARPGATTTGGGLRADVEGLRGVAVGMVLLYHLGLPGLGGGFVGVDVFFVVSGFLITSLLLREIDRTGSVSLRAFYARRARRLLPAASFVLVVTAVAGWWVLPGSAHENLGRDVASSALYVVNWELAGRSVDYLAEGESPSVLQHYWSLAVEEQFYVLWPLLVLLALAVARRRGLRARPLLLGAVSVVGLASFGWSVHLTATDPAAAYFVTTTRMWELAIGAALAFAVPRLGSLTPRLRALVATAGLAAVVAGGLALSPATAWPGSAALLPTLGAAAIIAAGTGGPTAGAARLLTWRPLVALGGISYALYLWHWPLIVLARAWHGPLGWLDSVALGLAALSLAWFTGRLVEDPLRFRPRLVRRAGTTLLAAALVTTVTAGTGVALVRTVPAFVVPDGADAPGARALVDDPSARPWRVNRDPGRFYSTEGRVLPDPSVAKKDGLLRRCQVSRDVTEPRLGGECTFGDVDSDERVMLLGDSKAGQWFPGLERIAEREGWRLDVHLKSSCPVSRTGVERMCTDHTDALLAEIADDPPDRAILSQHLGKGQYDHDDRGLEEAVGEVVDAGVEVLVLADNPAPPTDATFACVEQHPRAYDACAFDRDDALARSGTPRLTALAERLGLPVADVNEWICPPGVGARGGECPAVVAGTLVYRQGSHLTGTYVRSLTPMLHRELARLGWADTPAAEIRLGRR
ncbi:acyltransferase family protein [Nocardioides sp. CFH 31398]|uniref:acyltransferase family protein n=1 Tax=Nocardioides sp. CFH 31398 TaxID=2919579 RepID=UPI001F06EAE4|nr:acyltransferase family protein [Nocardioides sp. CFH 31398]MCH1868365.1 acyltransferase [Nocardioides sp. CFH 31398]